MIGRVRFIVYDKNAGLSCQNLQQEVYIMEKARVYYTDFRAKLGEGLPTKLKRLMKKAGISEIDMENKFVAIKMHFGEMGNISYLRPNYAKAVADVVKELGESHFLQIVIHYIRAVERTHWSIFTVHGRMDLHR